MGGVPLDSGDRLEGGRSWQQVGFDRGGAAIGCLRSELQAGSIRGPGPTYLPRSQEGQLDHETLRVP